MCQASSCWQGFPSLVSDIVAPNANRRHTCRSNRIQGSGALHLRLAGCFDIHSPRGIQVKLTFVWAYNFNAFKVCKASRDSELQHSLPHTAIGSKDHQHGCCIIIIADLVHSLFLESEVCSNELCTVAICISIGGGQGNAVATLSRLSCSCKRMT